MSITNRLKETLTEIDPNFMTSVHTRKCIKFTQEMKKAGLMRLDEIPASNPTERYSDQLKLYASLNIPY